AASPDVNNGGKTDVFAVEIHDVAGGPGGRGGAAEMPGGAGMTVAFSCSSKRTTSAILMSEFDAAATPAPEHAPTVIPSRQTLSLVLNAPVPPLMKRGTKSDGSGCRRSLLRIAGLGVKRS